MTVNLFDPSFVLSAIHEDSACSALVAAREVLQRLEEERDVILKDIEFQKQMIVELAAQAHLDTRRKRD